MMKAVKAVIAIAVILGLIWFLYHIWQQRQFKAQLDAANAAYAKAVTSQEFEQAKQGYEALLPKGRLKIGQAHTAEQKRMVQTGLTTCEADLAYFEAMDKGTIDNYTKALDLLKKAKELSGDSNGELAKRIAEIEPRLNQASGPSLEDMKKDLARLKAMPFDQAQRDLAALYRWRTLWHEQGRYVDDKEREAVFSETLTYLKDSYSRILDAYLAASRARGTNATDSDKVRILLDLENLDRVDSAYAAAVEEKYKNEFAEARAAALRLKNAQ